MVYGSGGKGRIVDGGSSSNRSSGSSDVITVVGKVIILVVVLAMVVKVSVEGMRGGPAKEDAIQFLLACQ